MEAQYYTPTIDEFHVGLEYEELRKDWVKLTYGGFLPKTIGEYLKEGAIRVKHLDRQDIEECGWKIDKHGNYYFKVNENWGYSLYYDKEEKVWSIDNGEEYEMWVQYFKGTIRNKSELKKLMQMLNIK